MQNRPNVDVLKDVPVLAGHGAWRRGSPGSRPSEPTKSMFVDQPGPMTVMSSSVPHSEATVSTTGSTVDCDTPIG